MAWMQNKPKEIVRIEYNAFGEREKVKKVALDPRSNLRSQPKSDSSRGLSASRLPAPICEGTDDTATRLEHTIKILRELLWGKIVRDEHAGTQCSMIDVTRQYFRVAFGVTEVEKEKMAALTETISELQKHSSFLRTMGRSLQNGLGPGQSAVFFSVWSLLTEKTRTGEENFVTETLPLSSFLQIFYEACDRHLSIPPTLQEIAEGHIMGRSERLLGSDTSPGTYEVGDLLELSVEALEKNDKSCLEIEGLLFSKLALPQNVLLPKGSHVPAKSAWNGSASKELALTSLKNVKLLLDELILRDGDRDGILPVNTVIQVLMIWQMCIDSTPMVSNGPKYECTYKDNARLITECFVQDDGESEVIDYIELIAFAHERTFEVKINSIEDLLGAISMFERGLDCGTYQRLREYVGSMILDRRRGLGHIAKDRIRAKHVRASKTPKSYVFTSTASCKKQTKTPIYLTEQQLYTEE